MGEPALWGKPPYGGNRPMGETAPNAVLEKAVAGYCQGYYGGTRPQRGFRKGYYGENRPQREL